MCFWRESEPGHGEIVKREEKTKQRKKHHTFFYINRENSSIRWNCVQKETKPGSMRRYSQSIFVIVAIFQIVFNGLSMLFHPDIRIKFTFQMWEFISFFFQSLTLPFALSFLSFPIVVACVKTIQSMHEFRSLLWFFIFLPFFQLHLDNMYINKYKSYICFLTEKQEKGKYQIEKGERKPNKIISKTWRPHTLASKQKRMRQKRQL